MYGSADARRSSTTAALWCWSAPPQMSTSQGSAAQTGAPQYIGLLKSHSYPPANGIWQDSRRDRLVRRLYRRALRHSNHASYNGLATHDDWSTTSGMRFLYCEYFHRATVLQLHRLRAVSRIIPLHVDRLATNNGLRCMHRHI
jgi:hypothetical protein